MKMENRKWKKSSICYKIDTFLKKNARALAYIIFFSYLCTRFL